jgi:hypothetical protein
MVKPNQATVELSIKRTFTNLRRVVVDLGGAASAVLVYVGDKLGLYRAMSDAGKPITSQELTAMTKTSERNIREWLANQTVALGVQAGESKIGEVVKAGGFKKFRRTAQTPYNIVYEVSS